MKKIFFFSALFLLTTLLPLTNAVAGSETRTVELFPLADSYVNRASPESNYGEELDLYTEFEGQRSIVKASSFVVSSEPRSIRVSLQKNGKILGSFEVTEGGDLDIDFWIEDEDSTIAYVQESRVTSLEFSFVAPYTGDFYLLFDNSFSWVEKTISLSEVILTMDPFGAICSPIFLLFDLSDIPPEATVDSAFISMSFRESRNQYSVIKTFMCSENDWDEQKITFENSPLSKLQSNSSSSLMLSGGSILNGSYCEWDVRADVAKSLPSGKLTEVLAIVESEASKGRVRFFSRESENKPKLEISYTYVSVGVSVSPTIIGQGQDVVIDVSTQPLQTGGALIIQYSSDQILWQDIATFSGGSEEYVWSPPVTGLIFLRALWSISWLGRSYDSSKTVSFHLDASAPSISIASPVMDGVVMSTSVVVVWNATDVSGIDYYEVRTDGGPWINTGLDTSHSFTDLADGNHTVEVKGVDKFGLSNVVSNNFVVNTSFIGEPGWIDDAAVFGVIIVVLTILTYLLKER